MLFCIDFDNTITCKHTYNGCIAPLLKVSKDLDAETIYKSFKDVQTLGKEENWQEFFETALKNGHCIAIVTFNKFEDSIKFYLERNIKLSKDCVSQIPVIAFLPKGYPNNNPNKNEHIQQAKEKLGLAIMNREVILIDDTIQNLNGAEKNGYLTIEARTDGSHLEKLLILSDQQAKKEVVTSLSQTPTSIWQPAEKLTHTDLSIDQINKPIASDHLPEKAIGNALTSDIWRRKSCEVVVKEKVLKKMKISS